MHEPRGYLCLVLHAHLPYVRHPEQPCFLEEDWLFEGINEAYLPVLEVLDGLVADGVRFRITLSLTPTLLGMLADSLLQERYLAHLDGLLELARAELRRTRDQPAFHRLAHMYLERFSRNRELYVGRYGKDLVGAFGRLQAAGVVEIMASAATHAYLPLLGVNHSAVRAQVAVGIEAYRRAFGHPPAGFWLPECGFHPDDAPLLDKHGVRYTVLDAHGLLHASPRPRYAVHAPVLCPGTTLAAFGRDWESSRQVWSSREGYPGDPHYREFYRDIGFDLDDEDVRPWLKADVRHHTGIKYYRITGPTADKQPYDPDAARRQAAAHAGHFLEQRLAQVHRLAAHMDRPPVVVAPYDAELFGHWWFEGPIWLDHLLRALGDRELPLAPLTPGDYLGRHPINQVSLPSLSSWGQNGYSEVWLEGSNAWLYPHLHMAADRMAELARRFPTAGGLHRRALDQAGRELLLMQASDWAFILKAGTAVGYARHRVEDHVHRFMTLYRQILDDAIDPDWLQEVEAQDNLFPWLDYRVYAAADFPVLASVRQPSATTSR